MNLLKKYTSGQMDAAIDWLEKYIRTSDAEALHQFRVSLKKVKAVMNYFLHQQRHHRKINRRKTQLAEIFKDAGLIRDAGIRIQWLKKNRCYILLKASLPETNYLLCSRLFIDKERKNTSSLKKIKEQLVLFCADEDAASVFSYSEKLRDEVFKSINAARKDDWHTLRKHIKQLLYAFHWNKKEDQLKLLKVKEYNFFDDLQESIGAWHDAENMKTWFGNEQFFLSDDVQVKKQFKTAWPKLLAEIHEKEIAVEQILKRWVAPKGGSPE